MRRIRWAIVSLVTCIALGMLGCASHNVYPRLLTYSHTEIDVNVYVDPSFDRDEVATIEAGLTMWQMATRGLVAWHLYRYDGCTPAERTDKRFHHTLNVIFHKASSNDSWVKAWDKQHKLTLYGLHQSGEIWLVEDRLKDVNTKVMIAAHEFGHALGLGHIKDERSVMSEYYARGVKHLTVHDIRAFCDVYPCLVGTVAP